MRSDYLGDCAEFRDLPETLNDCQYLVPRMTRAQRKEAIEVPLGRVDACAQPGAAHAQRCRRRARPAAGAPACADADLDPLARSRSEPHAAHRAADYESIGGFENALNQHADEVLAGVPAELAAIIFKRLTARGRSNRERRDPATLRELWAVCGATPRSNRPV